MSLFVDRTVRQMHHHQLTRENVQAMGGWRAFAIRLCRCSTAAHRSKNGNRSAGSVTTARARAHAHGLSGSKRYPTSAADRWIVPDMSASRTGKTQRVLQHQPDGRLSRIPAYGVLLDVRQHQRNGDQQPRPVNQVKVAQQTGLDLWKPRYSTWPNSIRRSRT